MTFLGLKPSPRFRSPVVAQSLPSCAMCIRPLTVGSDADRDGTSPHSPTPYAIIRSVEKEDQFSERDEGLLRTHSFNSRKFLPHYIRSRGRVS